MDNRRLDTAQVMAAGILSRTPPKTDIPYDRETAEAEDGDWNFIGAEAVAALIEEGKLLTASNYYGIPNAWKQGEGVYRGTLLQYCNVTEDPTFGTVAELAEWFERMYHATYG